MGIAVNLRLPSLAALAALATLATLAAAAPAAADPPASTRARTHSLILMGVASRTSTRSCYEASYELQNRTARPLTVDLVLLHSLGLSARRRLSIRGPRSLTLRPTERRRIDITFGGQALRSSIGLTYHRYRLTVRAEGQTLKAVASCAYVCRLPLRRDL